MAKPDLGIKRLCESCESKFYDLQRDPIVCPKCGTTFVEAKPAAKRAKPVASKDTASKDQENTEPEKEENAELVSLEDADEERGAGDDDNDNDESDIDIDAVDVDLNDDDDEEESDKDSFLEDDDEDSPNVSDLVGGATGDDED